MDKFNDLFSYPNVVLVGRGHKIVKGTDTKREAIVVGVTQKIPIVRLKVGQVIPSMFDGKVTDVIEVGEIKALRTGKYRPCPGGVSIGHYLVTAGTFGATVKKQGKRVILSNAHVLNNVNSGQVGDPVYQPGVYDGGTPMNRIGSVLMSVPVRFSGESTCPFAGLIASILNGLAKLFHRKTRMIPWVSEENKVDCAIALPDSDGIILDEILEIGKPTGYDIVDIGDRVKKSGRTTGLTYGTVLVMDARVTVDYGSDGKAIFVDQIITDMKSAGGDSGSAVLDDEDSIIGLLFAGSDTVTIVNKIDNVIEALELDV